MEVFYITTQEAIEIIKNSFCHLIYEENVQIGQFKIPLYFPSINIAILERRTVKESIENEKVECLVELAIQKELSAKAIYLNMHENNFNIGYVVNDILLEAGFIPTKEDEQESGENN